MTLLDTRAQQRGCAASFCSWRWPCPFLAAPLPARSRQPGAAGRDRRGGADAAHRRTPARSRSATPGCWPPAPSPPASWSRKSHAPFWVTLPAAALVGRRDRPDLRPAQPAAARPLPGGVDAGPALRGHLPRQRVRDPARLLHRRGDRAAEPRRHARSPIARAWYYVLLAFAAGHAAASASTCCAPGPGARGGRSRAARRWPRRSASTCPALQALGLHGQLDDDRGGGRAVLVLPRLRLGRGVLALPHHPVRGDGDHRRHGLDARRRAGRGVRDAVSRT